MKPVLNSDLLRSKLKLRHIQAQNLLTSRHPHIAKFLAAGVATTTLLSSPIMQLSVRSLLPAASVVSQTMPHDLQLSLKDSLVDILPKSVESLNSEQEQNISRLLHQTFGLHASAELEGNKLNHSYGLIGAEQHLPRYPGDTIDQHDAYQVAGITPGLGAWRYFAPSKSLMTPDLVAKERYYVAVQTLYLPDWTTRLAYLRDWYKYRKVVLVNPKNGKAIIAVVGDAGPAAWTGKHFGGSPEVMGYLEMKDGRQKGPVVLFFVDDPDNKVPLGPLDYNLESPYLLTS